MFELVLYLIYFIFRGLYFVARMAGYSLLLAFAFALALLGGAEEPEAEIDGEPREPSPGQADDGAEGGLPGWEVVLSEGSEDTAERGARVAAEPLGPAAAPTTF